MGLLGFFFAVAWTVELYFLVWHRELPARAPTELLARGFRLYGLADRGFYDRVTPLVLTLEGLNVFVMQPLCALLAYAIVRGRRYRWPLQLAIGSYLSLSVVIYFVVDAVAGHVNMREQSVAAYALLYGANLPWLVGYGWLAVDAGVTIARALAPISRLTPWRSARHTLPQPSRA